MRGPSFMVITGYKDGLPLKARTSNRRIASEEVNLSVNLEFKTESENYKEMRVSLSNM